MCGEDRVFKRFPAVVSREIFSLDTGEEKQPWEEPSDDDYQMKEFQSWIVIDLNLVDYWHPIGRGPKDDSLTNTCLFLSNGGSFVIDYDPSKFTQDMINYTGYYYESEEE